MSCSYREVEEVKVEDNHVDDEPAQTSLVAKVLTSYMRKASSGAVANRLGCALGFSRQWAWTLLRAGAELCERAQKDTFELLLHYVWTQKEAKKMHPLHLCVHVRYDETPQTLRINWGEGKAEAESSKVYAARHSWSMLVKVNASLCGADVEKHLLIRGCFSTALRASNSCTGESVAAVNHHMFDPDVPDSLFDRKVRLIESDEAKANSRGERLLAAHKGGWQRSHLMCSMHKIHASMEKTMEVTAPEVIQGMCRVLLCLQSSQQLTALRRCLQEVIMERLVIEPYVPLSADARDYRSSVLRICLPKGPLSRKHSTLCAICGLLFNSDWRRKEVVHGCQEGCCSSRKESEDKVKAAIPILFRTLRGRGVNRSNWLGWSKPLTFFLLHFLHGLLLDTFQRAFVHRPQARCA